MSRVGFAHEARRILAQAGGVNARSMRLLAAAARRHSVPIEEISDSLGTIDGDQTPIAGSTVPAPAIHAEPALAPDRPSLSVPVPPQLPHSAARLPQPTPLVPRPAPIPSQSRLRPIAPPAPQLANGSGPGTPNDPYADEVDPAARTLRVALTFGAIVLVGLVLGLASVWMIVTGLTSPNSKSTTPSSVSAPTSAPVASRAKKTQPATPGPGPELFPTAPVAKGTALPSLSAPATLPADADPVALVRAIDQASEQVSSEPVPATERFVDAATKLGRVWPSLPHDQAVRAQDSIVEFMYRGGQTPDSVDRAAAAIVAPAKVSVSGLSKLSKEQILPSIWATGIASRLTNERDLPAAARAAIEEAAGAAAGQSAATFSSGAASALARWPELIARSSAGQRGGEPAITLWREWLRACEAVAPPDPSAKSQFVISALETELVQGPEPADAGVIAVLVQGARWRAEDESRARLLRWFESPDITASDLRMVTMALAADSAASGVDVTMVLDVPADEPQRRDLRERYAKVWGMSEGPLRDALATTWAAATKAALDQSEKLPTPAEQLARSVVISRLNESASLIWSGHPQGVGDAIKDADKAILALLADAAAARTPQSLDDNASDGAWAIKYLSAEKNIQARGALLSDLSTMTTIGQVDAEVLAAEAFRGAPTGIRKAAQEAAGKFASSPAMVNAALEQSVNLPRTNENADLVRRLSLATLPTLHDPGWRAAVRRGLVERLLEMVAARGDQGLIDRLADLLAESYRGRVIASPADSQSAATEKVSPEIAARAVRASWLKWAQALNPSGNTPVTLDQVQRRIGGRSRLASGMIQAFAAEQVDTAELMAFVVAAEQPGSSASVAAVLDRLGKARRSADHIFAQILGTERAMAELWALRLGVPLS